MIGREGPQPLSDSRAMSIAEFYIENGIDPEDPEDLDRF